jgi:hypothetical protein
MQRFTDQQYLTQDQCKDASNLDARIAIHQKFSTNPHGWFNWIFDTLIKLPAQSKVTDAKPAIPQDFAFGAEPEKSWCYYYEKAELEL